MVWWTVAAVTVLVLVILVLAFVKYMTYDPPGIPPVVRWKGSRYGATGALMRDPLGFLTECRKQYGNVFTIDEILFRRVFVLGVQEMDDLYKTKDEIWDFNKGNEFFFRGILGPETLNPGADLAFHNERAIKIVNSLNAPKEVFFNHMKEETKLWAEELIKRGKPFNMYEEIDILVTNINIRCFVGEEIRKSAPKEFKDLYDELEEKGLSFFNILFYWLPFGTPRRVRYIRKQLNDIIQPIVDKRKREWEEEGKQYHDYLNAYVTIPHKDGTPWTRPELLERTLTIFFAARVNTLRTFFWTVMAIITRPNVLERLREEIDGLGEDFTLADLKKLEYMENTMRETVRPIFGGLSASRMCMKSMEYGGYTIPKGYYITTSPLVNNMDPEVFKEPERFNPDRWSPEGDIGKDAAFARKVWGFWGTGPHRCKGEIFAKQLVKTCWTLMFRDYDFKWLDQKEEGEMPAANPLIIMPPPNNPVMCTISRRGSSE